MFLNKEFLINLHEGNTDKLLGETCHHENVMWSKTPNLKDIQKK